MLNVNVLVGERVPPTMCQLSVIVQSDVWPLTPQLCPSYYHFASKTYYFASASAKPKHS